ncbi:MAG: hypothetical protein AAGU11_14940 [Syntrophobacteraceae bacterium]
MKINSKLASVLIFTVFLAGCSSFAGRGDRDMAYQQPRVQEPEQQQRASSREPLSRGTITGEVTEAGGLISEDGIPYRLNGAKAASLRDYTGQVVTVEGFLTRFEGDRAIIVQNFQATEPSPTARSEQEQMNARSGQPDRRQDISRDADAPERTGAQPDWQNQPRRSQNLPADRQREQMNAQGDRPDRRQGISRDADAPERTGAQPDWQNQPRRNQNLPADRQREQMSPDADAPGMNNNMQPDVETNP